MRTVDTVIEYIAASEYLSAVDKRILIRRIDTPPTEEELEEARKELFGGQNVRKSE